MRPKDIGTAAETAVSRALQRLGFPHAERRTLRGTRDAGDITGTPGVCWEVKGGRTAKSITDGLLTTWMQQLKVETANAGAYCGVLVVQRGGHGPTNAHRWWAYMTVDSVAILAGYSYEWSNDRFTFPVRMFLSDACAILRDAGYGEKHAAVDSPAQDGAA